MQLILDRAVLVLAEFFLLESSSPAPINPPILDDRTYDDLRTETVSRIPTHTPEWTNYNESDPGFRLLDFFRLLDTSVLEDLLIEYHEFSFWSGFPLESETYRGQFAYVWLDAALTSAEDPNSIRPATWLTDYGIDPDWTLDELLAAANVPEPASAVLMMGAMAWFLRYGSRVLIPMSQKKRTIVMMKRTTKVAGKSRRRALQ